MDLDYLFAAAFFLGGCAGVGILWLFKKADQPPRTTVLYWDRAKGKWIEFGKDF